MQVEAHAVPERMEETLLEHLARSLVELGWVTMLLEELADDTMDLRAADAGLDRLERAAERLPAEPLVLDQLLGRFADAKRPGHVGPAPRIRIAREQVDDDRLALRDRPVAGLVPHG